MENRKVVNVLLALSIVLLLAGAGLAGSIWHNWSKISLPDTNVAAPLLPPISVTDNAADDAVANQPVQEETSGLVKVVKVVDGDTIVLENKQTVRYIGIDTPETVDPRRPVGCYGKEASNVNKALVEGKMVRLEKDISETDKYNRLLRYIYLPTENGELFVNDYLVRQGFAKSSSYPPDIKHQDQFTQAQQEARENSRGLWGACSSK